MSPHTSRQGKYYYPVTNLSPPSATMLTKKSSASSKTLPNTLFHSEICHSTKAESSFKARAHRGSERNCHWEFEQYYRKTDIQQRSQTVTAHWPSKQQQMQTSRSVCWCLIPMSEGSKMLPQVPFGSFGLSVLFLDILKTTTHIGMFGLWALANYSDPSQTLVPCRVQWQTPFPPFQNKFIHLVYHFFFRNIRKQL